MENKLLMNIKRKYKILHIVSKLPIGGVEKQLFDMVTNYDKELFEAIICCINEGGEIADKLKELGYKIIILNRMKNHGFDFKAVIDIYKLIKREKIDILRTDQYHASLYGRIAGLLANVPAIIPTFHNLYNSPHKPKIHRRILNWVLSFFSDKIIAVSQAVAYDIHRYDKIKFKKIEIIYNGISLKEFKINTSKAELKKKFNLPSSLIIGTVGRLTEQKGHEYLIKAVAGLKDISIAIAGDGPLRKYLEDLATDLRVNCIFMNTLKAEEIPYFLKSIDIFCFPSLWEGFGIALVEAMAAGLPVVATDIAPHREILGDKGIYFPIKNVNILSDILKKLIENESERKRIGNLSEKRAELFSIENTVLNYEKLFKEILSKKNEYTYTPS